MWTQIVGKVRMALSPHVNHWWEVPLYVSSVGLTTSPIPYHDGNFEMEFDFLHHNLNIRTSDDKTKSLSLTPKSVAKFYAEVMSALAGLGIKVKIWSMPVEIPNPIRFDQDNEHDSYDPEYANRFWRILVTVDNILKEFRARYLGKVSPVHFFGAASIWPSPVFRDVALLRARAPILSRLMPIPRKSAASDSGRALEISQRPLFTPTLRLHHPTSGSSQCVLRKLFTARSFRNSY